MSSARRHAVASRAGALSVVRDSRRPDAREAAPTPDSHPEVAIPVRNRRSAMFRETSRGRRVCHERSRSVAAAADPGDGSAAAAARR